MNPNIGRGIFCAHDWSSSRFEKKVEQKAYDYAEKIGKYLKDKGYKGIFGLDLVLDSKTKALYMVECNARLLGSYPVLEMVQVMNKEIPLLSFHILESLGLKYNINTDYINKLLKKPKKGSHVILFNKFEKKVSSRGFLQAGVYEFHGKLVFKRPGYSLSDLKKNDEFLIADSVPFRGTEFNRHRRILRILFMKKIMDPKTFKLNKWSSDVVKKIYKELDLH